MLGWACYTAAVQRLRDELRRQLHDASSRRISYFVENYRAGTFARAPREADVAAMLQPGDGHALAGLLGAQLGGVVACTAAQTG